MRLPQIRFSVGTLLFCVAVVAANCWGFRHWTEEAPFVCGRPSYRPLPVSVGALPLLDAASIGLWCFATKWLRSRRHARSEYDPSPWPGAIYFSLHFLLLGFVISSWSPGAAEEAAGLLDDVTGCAAIAWEAVLSEPGEGMSWCILDSSILGVLVSGPPLILSWVGGVLAMRCAAKMSRLRFRVMTCLISLGFASAGLAIALAPQEFYEEQDVGFQVEVIDRASGRPIEGAVICVTDPFA